MEKIKGIRITRGANLSLNGDAEKILSKTITSSTYALKPDDFFGMIPKLLVKEGAVLQKGQAVFFSKTDPRIKFVSPIAGTLKAIQRGAKRKIEKIIIEESETQESLKYDVEDWQSLGKDALISILLESGNWPFIKQRPYGILANPEDTPKAIFVSTFDTAPMGVDFQYILNKDQEAFQTGIDVLNRLVDQPTYMGLDKSFSGFFEKIQNVQSYDISGPHPAGNVSLHIQKLCPLNMGDRIWTVRPEDVANIGRFFLSGHFSPIRTVAVAGNAVQNPKYFPTYIGVEMKSLLEDLTLENNIRVINGDVLSGTTSHSEDHLGYF
ncbi:MAG: NADH:ubiquinone reductase (Na(+)-transporting) subunit A, partial [Flavobacteriaceae bacterium]